MRSYAIATKCQMLPLLHQQYTFWEYEIYVFVSFANSKSDSGGEGRGPCNISGIPDKT